MSTFSRILVVFFVTIFAVVYLNGCSNPQPGPDKTLAGTVLGAGWGAGAGAVVGNQVSTSGLGAGLGSGIGAVAGALTGAAYDLSEGAQLEEERKLASLKIQNTANARGLEDLQARLDRAIATELSGGMYQVFFDPDGTNLRAGSVSNLEVLADSIKASPHAYVVNVVGHADDSGTPEYNDRLAESRARSVSAYLGQRGVSMGQIKVTSYGSKRPLVTNGTEAGRQLNRRVDIFLGKRD